MDQVKIGKFILKCRKEKNITQQNLADNLGVSYKTVSNWENGRNMPDVSLFKPLCEELGININELLNGENDNADNGLVDYLKYQKKRNKVKIIISGIVIFFIVLLSILSIFFINNYNKVHAYILSGSSDNFEYHDDLLILSNIKNINAFGELSIKNSSINESDIIQMSLNYNGEKMLEGTVLSGVAYEINGYDDCFQEEARKNIDKWYIEITYTLNKEKKVEKIPLVVNNILRNDNLFYKQSEKVSDGPIINTNSLSEKRDKYLKEVKDELIKNHDFKGVDGSTAKGKVISYFTLIKNLGNREFIYYSAFGMWRTASENGKDKFSGNIRSKYIGYTDVNGNTYSYDYLAEKFVRCNGKKCNSAPDNIEKLVKDFVEAYKREFDGLFNLYKNEILEDDYEDI